jgi:hypothetical protein
MLLGSFDMTRVACAIARSVAPCITTTGGSVDDEDIDLALDEESSVIVKVGAAGVGV